MVYVADQIYDKEVMLQSQYERKFTLIAPLMHRIADYALGVMDGNKFIKVIDVGARKDALLPINAMEEIYKKIEAISSGADRLAVIRRFLIILLPITLLAILFFPNYNFKFINIRLTLILFVFLSFIASVIFAIKITGEVSRQRANTSALLAENMVQKFKILLNMLHFSHQIKNRFFYEITKEISSEEHSCIKFIYWATTKTAIEKRRKKNLLHK